MVVRYFQSMGENDRLSYLPVRTEGTGCSTATVLSYIRPHGLVTAQQLSHWLKEILKCAGVDTAVFKAHSVRGTSSTAAFEKGVANPLHSRLGH